MNYTLCEKMSWQEPVIICYYVLLILVINSMLLSHLFIKVQHEWSKKRTAVGLEATAIEMHPINWKLQHLSAHLTFITIILHCTWVKQRTSLLSLRSRECFPLFFCTFLFLCGKGTLSGNFFSNGKKIHLILWRYLRMAKNWQTKWVDKLFPHLAEQDDQ